LRDYFWRFVQVKAKAPNVLEEVAIEAAIKGLRLGPFAAHLAREKPTSMQELYNEFEKYCKSDNDLRKRLEEQNQNKQQGNNRNTQRNNASQGQQQQKQGQSQQFSILSSLAIASKGRHLCRQEHKTQPKGPKNQKQRQRKQYYFFHGEDKGHVTRDCLDAKETHEKIKSRVNP
jgi:hypothetical protein